MPPSYVKAYLKRSKNDANDAAAICEAVTRPSMRFVPVKTEEQQTGLMLHRSRQLLVRQRTMLSNAIRGHLAELGITSAKGRNGTGELLQVIANVEDDRIPLAARFCLEVLTRQYVTVTAEVGCHRQAHSCLASLVRRKAARGDARHWPDCRHCTGCRDRRLEAVPLRAQCRCMDWIGAETAFDWRQGAARAQAPCPLMALSGHSGYASECPLSALSGQPNRGRFCLIRGKLMSPQ